MSAWFVRMISTNCATVAIVSLRTSRAGVTVAVPLDRPVPGFIQQEQWVFQGTLHPATLSHLGFALTLPKAAHGSMASILSDAFHERSSEAAHSS